MTAARDHRSQWDAYGELWTITDVAARREACDGVLATSCTYTDPTAHAEGVEEIVDYMTQFQQNAHGATSSPRRSWITTTARWLGGPWRSATGPSSGQAPRSPPTTPPAP